MRARTPIDVANIETSVQQVRATSDGWAGGKRFGVGLDAILTFVPGVGEVYALGAAGYLLLQGYKARVPGIVLMQMAALLSVDFATEAIPFAGSVADVLFCGHLWAGTLLLRAMRHTAYIEPGSAAAINEQVCAAKAAQTHIVLLG